MLATQMAPVKKQLTFYFLGGVKLKTKINSPHKISLVYVRHKPVTPGGTPGTQRAIRPAEIK
jgi:RecB family exonuclease